MGNSERQGRPVLKAFLIGCGLLTLIGIIAVVWFAVWLFTSPESGVKLGNEMDAYALEYLDEHGILAPGEEILAYYDVTVSMNGTEAAILTDARVIYHKDPHTSSVEIGEIQDIRHRYESMVGDVIEVESHSGRTLKIEIAPWNQGETFKNVLMAAWDRARSQPGEN